MAIAKPVGPGQGLPEDWDESGLPDDDGLPEDDGFEIEFYDDLPEDLTFDGYEVAGEDEDAPAGSEDFDANLAAYIDDRDLAKIANELIELFEEDDDNRSELKETYKKGMELLGLKIEERTDPWEGACGVYHPLLAEALTRFSSEAIMETFPAGGPALTKIIGEETPELLKRARRIKDELNYQLTKKVPEYRLELEMIYWRQPLAGSCFRKIWWDPDLRRIRSAMVPFENFVVSYGTTALETSPRYTHVQYADENAIRKLIARGVYRDYEFGSDVTDKDDIEEETDKQTGVESSTLVDTRRKILEMYVDYDLPGFEDERGIALPYVISIDVNAQTIVSIYRNYPEGNPLERNRKCFFHYKYLPGFGFYGTGLCQLLGGITDSATSILRQLIDAGTLANIPGGLKTRGVRIKGDDSPIKPGEFRDVDVVSGKLSDGLIFLPHKEPSPVLAQLLQSLIDEGRRIGSVADAKIADINQQSPVGTTLAIIERVMRVMSAVQARVNVTMSEELEYIAHLLQERGDPEYEYPVEGDYLRSEDFGPPIQILPVADPSATTISQRMIRYQMALEMAGTSPHLYDLARLHRQAMEILEIKDADKIVPLADDMAPVDPVSENMNILMMRPVKAFLQQDHQAHIQVHMAAMQDPMIQQMVGQSPNAPAIQAAAMAHIQEHLAYAYRQKMEEALGVALPPPNEALPDAVEAQIARLAAAAAPVVLGKSQQEAAAMAAQQAAQDPKLAIEQRKDETKRLEIQQREEADRRRAAIDEKKLQQEAYLGDRKLDIDEMKVGIGTVADLKKHEDQIAAQRENTLESRRSQELQKAADLAERRRQSQEKRQSDAEKTAAQERMNKEKAKNARKPAAKTSGSGSRRK
ncbi:hypothetical protein EBQ81_01205, partial [bacterium]|nr:hypothetical protein [bacterium]